MNADLYAALRSAEEQYSCYCLLNSNGFQDQYSKHPFLLALGQRDCCANWEDLEAFLDRNKGNWQFGFLTYDLKNRFENLSSAHADGLGFPELHFFVPEKIYSEKAPFNSSTQKEKILEKTKLILLKSRFSKESYLQKVKAIQEHIREGDVYELNLCMEFYAEEVRLNPLDLYRRLNERSPAPFSAFYRNQEQYLICSSPERFLQKEGTVLRSQPIKGTAARSTDPIQDEAFKNALRASEKERAENVMIVDLVRNDLHRICETGSVQVDELFGIYSFAQVHQMISTISGKVRAGIDFPEILKSSFPMGSMTGAPKIAAMELIERYEETKRGLYSGSIGYINPKGDFDFNVVIRSILYDRSKGYLSFQVGSAITIDSDPEAEYEECLVKAAAMRKVLET